MIYRLPQSLRKSFAKPMGPLFEGPPAQSLPKAIDWMKSICPDLFIDPALAQKYSIICVGDIVSNAMLSHPLLQSIVKLCFIDGETQRGKEVGQKLPKGMKKKSINNPRGAISDAAIQFLRETKLSPQRYLVQVVGEEDLLVIPAILEYEQAFVFYGQPPMTDLQPPIPAGCVGLFPTPELKSTLADLFSKFEKVSA